MKNTYIMLQKIFHFYRKEGFISLLKKIKLILKQRFGKRYSPENISHDEALKWFQDRKGSYEKLIRAVRPYLNSNAIIFDIGANIGYFSLLLADELNFKGKIYLFEPVPNLAKLCKITFEKASYEAKVFEFGLSDVESKEHIHIASDGNIGWNTLISEKAQSNMEKVEIQLKTLNSIDIPNRPTFIKIDVEGAEYKVFRGMYTYLSMCSPLPVILCEIGWGNKHPKWLEVKESLEQMEKMGYTICNLDGKKLNISALDTTTDVLMLPINV